MSRSLDLLGVARKDVDFVVARRTHEIVGKPYLSEERFAVIVTTGVDTIVAVRGTSSWKDWFVNAEVSKSNLEPGKVHEGFLEAALDLWKGTQDEPGIDQLLGGTERLWFAGHSMGGAVAVLLAALALDSKHGDAVRAVYTLAQPKVGDEDFGSALLSRLPTCFAVQSTGDPVPRVKRPSLGHLGCKRIPLDASYPGIDGKLATRHRMRNYLCLLARQADQHLPAGCKRLDEG